MDLRKLNERRRLALIDDIYRNDFKRMGYRKVPRRYPSEGRSVSITKNKVIDISFDVSYASDYKEDAYRWCYIDFFITQPNINLPDPLKRSFTRVMDGKKRLYWRHRGLVRVIDMDVAADTIDKTRRELTKLLEKHSILPKRSEKK